MWGWLERRTLLFAALYIFYVYIYRSILPKQTVAL